MTSKENVLSAKYWIIKLRNNFSLVERISNIPQLIEYKKIGDRVYKYTLLNGESIDNEMFQYKTKAYCGKFVCASNSLSLIKHKLVLFKKNYYLNKKGEK